jgi:hypothetical protein
VRSYELMPDARRAFERVGPDLRRAVVDVIAEMLDEDVPLVRPGDFSVTRGPQIMARPVRGTDLAVYYLPAGVHVFVVDVVRQAPA